MNKIYDKDKDACRTEIVGQPSNQLDQWIAKVTCGKGSKKYKDKKSHSHYITVNSISSLIRTASKLHD